MALYKLAYIIIIIIITACKFLMWFVLPSCTSGKYAAGSNWWSDCTYWAVCEWTWATYHFQHKEVYKIILCYYVFKIYFFLTPKYILTILNLTGGKTSVFIWKKNICNCIQTYLKLQFSIISLWIHNKLLKCNLIEA